MEEGQSIITRQLIDLLKERISRLRNVLADGVACTHEELTRFLWATARAISFQLQPEICNVQWKLWRVFQDVFGEILDFDIFDPNSYSVFCVKAVPRASVLETFLKYESHLQGNAIMTYKQPEPKILGHTKDLLFLDKPASFLCDYANREPPPRSGAKSVAELLNNDRAKIQMHEYVALAFDFETARQARKRLQDARRWGDSKTDDGDTFDDLFKCQDSPEANSGCCNALAEQTSGTLVVAKDSCTFWSLRRQFCSSSFAGKKYYLALVHGIVEVPKTKQSKGPHWRLSPDAGRGKIQVALSWDPVAGKAKAFSSEGEPSKAGKANGKKNGKGKTKGKKRRQNNNEPPFLSESDEEYEDDSDPDVPQEAVSLYEPLAILTDQAAASDRHYTLLRVEILTGRRDQIRCHLGEIGHPVAGDSLYCGAHYIPFCGGVAGRRFLHSYMTTLKDPSSKQVLAITCPLPCELGNMLGKLKIEKLVPPVVSMREPLLSWEDHPELHSLFQQCSREHTLVCSSSGKEPRGRKRTAEE